MAKPSESRFTADWLHMFAFIHKDTTVDIQQGGNHKMPVQIKKSDGLLLVKNRLGEEFFSTWCVCRLIYDCLRRRLMANSAEVLLLRACSIDAF
jgi:hypothetical protein